MTQLRAGGAVMWRRLFLLLFILAGIGTQVSSGQDAGNDWTQFGWDLASSGASSVPTGITPANAASLIRHQIKLDGTVDASAIYLRGATVQGSRHDVFFVTTTYGKTIAVDANQGAILWEYTPPKYDSWVGTRQISNSTPVADPDRHHIYAAAPDGTVHKLAVFDGHVLWTTPITLLPLREKIASPLKAFRGHIIAVTGGYIGDRPPYQGHVVILDAQTGKLLHVWNSLCSDRSGLLDPSSCPDTQSAIWGRAGAVIDVATGNIFVATGNGPYDGKRNWGDSTIELNPDATQMLGNYTPEDNAHLDDRDLDVGSTSPALLGGDVVAQGGKDGLIRLLSIKTIAGTTPHAGGELQSVSTPSGGRLFTALAVWRHGGDTWLFSADGGGTAAWTFQSGKLVAMWKNSKGGTSPVVAGGLLYVYSPKGALSVYDPEKGTQIAELECGKGHWNSPIVVDGKIALPEGDANQSASTGVLEIWTLPAGQ
jgi:outer membrane protein assembly factor BamB